MHFEEIKIALKEHRISQDEALQLLDLLPECFPRDVVQARMLRLLKNTPSEPGDRTEYGLAQRWATRCSRLRAGVP